MNDMRDKCPEKIVINPEYVVGNDRFEIELRCCTFSGVKQDEVMAKFITYKISAASFRDAYATAIPLRDTVRAMYDIWVCDIVRIEEI